MCEELTVSVTAGKLKAWFNVTNSLSNALLDMGHRHISEQLMGVADDIYNEVNPVGDEDVQQK